MTAPQQPKFLARSSYRRRRMIDAARVLPLVAGFLFFVPVLWRPSETPEPDTAHGGIYIFIVWTCLIIAAFCLSRFLQRVGRKQDGAEGEETGGPD